MLKKITKLCLATAAFALIAGQASAADVKADVNGFGWGYYSSYSSKSNSDADTINKQGFDNKGRLGTVVTTTAGDWKAGGKFEMNVKDDGSLDHRDKYAFVEYKNISVSIGRQWYGGVTKLMKYYMDEFNIYQLTVGENCTYDGSKNFCRTDGLVVDLKDYGFSFRFGQDYHSANGTGDDNLDYKYAKLDKNGVAVTDSDGNTEYVEVYQTGEFQETLFNAVYATSFGALDLGVEYNTSRTTVDDKDASALKDGEYDGASMSSIAAGVAFKINEKMAVKGNFETTNKKSGASGADTLNTIIMMAAFDFAINDTMGISTSYGVDKTDDSDSDDTTTSIAMVSFQKKIADAQLFAQYANKTVDSDVDSKDGGKASELAVGLFYAF